MSLNEVILNEFPSPEYDREFINDVVDSYQGRINRNGDLMDNMGLFNHIWDNLVAIEHPGTSDIIFKDIESLFDSFYRY